MRTMTAILVAAVVISWGLTTATADAAPEPSKLNQSWQLDFRFEPPRRITVQLPDQEQPTTYWYVLCTVTNRTDEDVLFYPRFTLLTNTCQTIEAGQDVNPAAYTAIKKRHHATYPLLQPMVSAIGRVLQGQDNAIDTVAIWKDFDPKADNFTIFVSGLSGETQPIRNPAYDRQADENTDATGDADTNKAAQPEFFYLRKTLRIQYAIPSDPVTRTKARPYRSTRMDWIMR